MMAARKHLVWIEVALAVLAYVALSRLAVGAVDVSGILPEFLDDREARVGGVFAVGAVAQLLFIAAALLLPGAAEFREAARNSVRAAPARAWILALIAAAIQCFTVATFFIPDARMIIEPSARNLLLSLLPAADGWTQEVMFRGYVMLRLAKAGAPPWLQVAASAAAFASIHVGYIGSPNLGIFWPLLGTGMLGAFLALSVLAARNSLLPAVVAHVLIVIIVQPWLALAR